MKTYVLTNVSEVEEWQDNRLPFNAQLLEKHGASAHLLVADGERIGARCSVWISSLRLHEKLVGFIGHYATLSDEAAHQVLSAACAWLYQQNCEVAIGPLDGNTWRSYRFVVQQGEHPPFLLEPQNPTSYPQQFVNAGFGTLTHYSSVLCSDLHRSQAHLTDVEKRLTNSGVNICALKLSDWHEELRRIYDVSCKSFTRNFLYEPISENEFLSQYHDVQNMVVPELVLLAECKGKAVGFSFSYPDFMQLQRGEMMDRIIVKTVAVLPRRRFAGLGNLLAEKTHRVAQEMGFKSAIHALIHDGNVSRNVSTRYGETMRRYALFARDLTL